MNGAWQGSFQISDSRFSPRLWMVLKLFFVRGNDCTQEHGTLETGFRIFFFPFFFSFQTRSMVVSSIAKLGQRSCEDCKLGGGKFV